MGRRRRTGWKLWYDNVENITLGKKPNVPLVYDPVLEHQHPIMSTLGDPGGQIYIEREF